MTRESIGLGEGTSERGARVPMAFLLANWYSGATLLTLLLDRHPAIVSNGEGFYHRFRTGDTICSCGESVKSCPFYRHAAAGMWAATDYDARLFAVAPRIFEDGPLRRLLENTRFTGAWRRKIIRSVPSLRRAYDAFLHAHLQFMRRALALEHAELYLDGTKSIRRAEIFLSESGLQSSPLLLLVRHPYSWCASWLDKRDGADLDNAIHTWNEYVRRSFRLHERFHAAPFRVVRYEDLCQDPEDELAAIERWLGVPAGGSLRAAQHTHHVLGNRMRFEFDGTVHSPTDRAGELSPAQRREIARRCARWMDAVGYDAPV